MKYIIFLLALSGCATTAPESRCSFSSMQDIEYRDCMDRASMEHMQDIKDQNDVNIGLGAANVLLGIGNILMMVSP